MTVDEAREIIAKYDALAEQVLRIARGTPFHASVEEDVPVYIEVSENGHEVTLTWQERESDYYGGSYMRDESRTFPSALLLLSAEDLRSFQRGKELEDAAKRARHAAVLRAQEQVNERNFYERLKSKYGETQGGIG